MTPATLALVQAERLLQERCCALAARIVSGDDTVWNEYVAAVTALRALIPEERAPLLTTRQAAEKFQVSPRTIRAKGKRLGLEAIRSGKRGTGAIRWRSA